MCEYEKKKSYLVISIIIVVLTCVIVSLVSFNVRKRKGTLKNESFEEMHTSIAAKLVTEDNTEIYIDPEKNSNGTVASEPSVYDSNMYFENDNREEYGKKKVGSIIIDFNTDDAVTGNGNAAGTPVDAVSFHDGNADNLKGYIFAVKAVIDKGHIETIEEARDCVGEYIPAGSGITFDWEETENFFIRRAIGYDNESNAAFLFHTIVPKGGNVDSYLYSAVYILDEDGPVKESSYNSMSLPLSDYIPDSSFLKESYEDVCGELTHVLNNRTLFGQELDGMKELRSASSQWYMDVYGVENEEEYNRLSEDEKADLYWRYKDPVGYSQVKEKEGVIPRKENDTETMQIETLQEEIIMTE